MGRAKSCERALLAAAALPLFGAALHAQVSELWSETYGHLPDATVGWKCTSTAAGSFWVWARAFYQPPGSTVFSSDDYLLRYSSSGVLQGVTDLGGAGASIIYGLGLAAAPAGGVYSLCGGPTNTAEVLLRSVSPVGAIQWTQTYDIGVAGAGYDLVADSSGAPVFFVSTSNGGKLARYSPAGAFDWDADLTFGAAVGSAETIAASPLGEVWVSGRSSAIGVHRFSNDGVPQSFTSFAFGSNSASTSTALAVDSTGACACVGAASAPGNLQGPPGIALLDPSGALVWSTTLSLNPGPLETFDDVAFGTDGTIWACGRTGLQTLLAHFDRNGALLSSTTWSAPLGRTALAAGTAGEVVVVGGGGAVRQFDSGGQLTWSWTTAMIWIGDVEIGEDGLVVVTGAESPSYGETYSSTVGIDAGDYPVAYCTAKPNSLGCVPLASYVGVSSASATSGFAIVVSPLLNQRSGLLAYSISGPSQAPFQGGYLCLQSPLRRTPVASSGGASNPVTDCSGVFVLDMNRFASGALGSSPAVELSTVGATIWCQHWSRDPGSPSTTGLSNGLAYSVLP